MRRRSISTGKEAEHERRRQCIGDVAVGWPRSRTARVGGAPGRCALGPGRLGGGVGDGGNRQDDGADGSKSTGEGGRYADPERAGRGRRGRAAVLAVAQRARAGSGVGPRSEVARPQHQPASPGPLSGGGANVGGVPRGGTSGGSGGGSGRPAVGRYGVMADLAAPGGRCGHIATAHRRGHSGPEWVCGRRWCLQTSDRCRWGRGIGRTSARTHKRSSVARSVRPRPRTCTAVAPEFPSLFVNSSESSDNPAVSTPRRPNLGCRAHCDRCWSIDSTP